ncbi:MAG: peptidase M14 [Ignavibacteriaceae bacterium]|nr:peptidase M14 [Ignavibacteriaceae bacterium]
MIKKFILLLTISLELTMAQNIELAQSLYNNYELFREKTLLHKRLKHAEILPLIEALKKDKNFSVKKAGESAEGREIFLISIGKGNSKVFLWSQMHGDEATATMALFDIFNFFRTQDEFSNYKKVILENLSIYFMPMVNPDGAEKYQRRTSFEIDINRDFNRLQTPEALLLRETFEDLKAEFGFNLHDQSTRYAVGNTYKSAAIAFLAPSLDHQKSIDSVRDNSMKLISTLTKMLEQFIPGHIAKYKDDYEPRAFGDNFQKLGTSTILIESGIWKDDRENQYIRKLNFITLITALYSIATKSYKHQSTKIYEQIPQNEERIFDLLLRNLKYNNGKEIIITDLGINQNEVSFNKSTEFYISSTVQDIGDLSVFYGFNEFDFSGYELSMGKTYPEEFSSIKELERYDLNKLYRKGYTNVKLKSAKFNLPFTKLPINIKLNNNKTKMHGIKLLGSKPNFIIQKNGEVHFAVINGFLIGVKFPYGKVENALVE